MTAKLSNFCTQASTYASNWYQQAVNYLSRGEPTQNPKWVVKTKVVLEGPAKNAGIELSALNHQESQFKRISNVVTSVFGGLIACKQLWNLNPQFMVTGAAAYCVNQLAHKVISSYFQPDRARLTMSIDQLLKTKQA